MAHIDFGRTPEDAMQVLKTMVSTMHGDLYGNGQPGIIKRICSFLDKEEGAEEQREKQKTEEHAEQERRHRENSHKLNVIMACFAGFAIIVTIFLFWAGIYISHHASLDLPNLIRQQHPAQIMADADHSFLADQ